MGGEFVEVNGTRLYYEVSGDSNASAVVLVHGFSLDTRMWDGQVEAFHERFRVVRYDLRSFGQSAIPEAGVHYQHHADLAALLDHLGISTAALVGLSLGGAIALDFVLHHPERVTALILVGSVLPGMATPDLGSLSRDVWKAGQAGGADAAKALWVECSLFDAVNQRPVARTALREMVAGYSGWGWTDRDPGTWGEPDCAARLGEIDVPTLIVVGEHDIEGMRRNAEVLVAGIPGARHIVLPGLGHLPNMEDAAAFNPVVIEHLTATIPGRA